MGNIFAKLFDLFGDKEMKVIMIGLDGAGKTTILYQLKLGEMVTCLPTIGFNVETICYKNINLIVWDIGGQEKIRPLWSHYYSGAQGVIFVIDCADHDRLVEAEMEFHKLLKVEQLQTTVFLILANKQDFPGAISPAGIIEKFKLREVDSRVWHVQGCIGVNKEGLYDGLDWFVKELLKKG